MRHLIAVACAALAWGAWATTVAQAHPDHGCDSCHVPHNSVGEHDTVPLWNPEHTETLLLAEVTYSGSVTMDATLAGPTGASKLCLSCHDGSYPHVSTDHTFADGDEFGMGVLENSHPISFSYAEAQSSDGELKPIDQLPEGALDGNGDVQCTSCHDVHATAATYDRGDSGNNLRWKYENEYDYGYATLNNAAFCRNCHAK